MSRPDVCIFIPSYNAEKTLAAVIARIPDEIRERTDRIVVVNDGSTDRTAEVATEIAKEDPLVDLVSLPQNQGYGGAVQAGIEACRSREPAFAICLHSDGQYPPESIPEFLDYMTTNEIALLQGSRHAKGTKPLEGGMPVYKWIAGKCLTLLTNTIFPGRMTDYFSGYLIYDSRALHQLPIEKLSRSFDFDFEVIACCHAAGLPVAEQGIPTRYADEESHLEPIAYGFRVLGVLRRYMVGHYHGLVRETSRA